ncbi:hypothetical protein JOA01_00310 [Streptococcus parasuis]|uniref:hypothetical protein n=1 Tax=Streptococcus parasuis TaxID=1501662 RepID=UPI001C1FA626|nr:hypothetical protein [Streptococcus parasuis]MDG3146185.1 hypothetical protein [Streptococcus suis]MBV1944435.1 hypothetical protein [Streptococcus parasuis]MDG3213419.1 hypothetical protein [Streptococcus suis]QWV85731.1 hypothetical protein KQ224_06415 [Streptococcus parasuis]QXF05561.1 hypothetical protein JOA01_00310 [Streptococcus parasuis]
MIKLEENFTVLEDRELFEVEGGIVPVILFFAGVGSGIASTSTAIYTLNRVSKLKW